MWGGVGAYIYCIYKHCQYDDDDADDDDDYDGIAS